MSANEAGPEMQELQGRLGHVFRRGEWLELAVTHRSYAVETSQPAPDESQRLEFLGDAVLGMIAAEWLFARCPDWREGRLTKIRSRLTNEKALARVARGVPLGAYLRLGRGEEQGGGRDRDGVLADALEAVMGAIWLDGGLEAARRFFRERFAAEIEAALAAGVEENSKGELQERMQRVWKTSPRYELVSETGPAHDRVFRVRVGRGEEPLGEGEGKTKQQAEMNAAQQALDRWVEPNGV